MPIRGLSERGRIPRIGKIHLGYKVESQKRPGVFYPKAAEHFILNDAPYVKEVYGDKPTELRIMFPSEDDEKIASQYYKQYKATTGLICKGDGFKATARVDSAKWKGVVQLGIWAGSETAETQMVEIPCAGAGYDGSPACPAYEKGDCKRIMVLQFFVLGCRKFGIHQLDTSSVNGILNINGMLDILRNSRVLGGHVSGVKLLLTLIPQEVIADGKKKIVRVVQLTAEQDIEELRKLELPPVPQITAPSGTLPSPVVQPEVVEGEIVVEEPDESTMPFEDLPIAAEESLEEEVDTNAKSGPPAAPPVTPAAEMACEHLPRGEVNRRWQIVKQQNADRALCICCGGPAKRVEGQEEPPRCKDCSEE